MSHVPEQGPFSLLPDKRPPWIQFLLSMSTQGVALVVLAWVGVLHPEILPLPAHDHLVAMITAAPPINHRPAPLRVIKAPVPEPTHDVLRLPPETRHKVQPDDLPAAPKITLAASKPMPLPPSAAPVIPRQLVKTNVFSTGSSATPTIAAAPQKVQTGGFGDPNGVPTHENHGKPVTIAGLGSFDLPAGPGYGNGTGGASRTRGVVASAGFGNGTAIGDGSGTTNTTRGTARQAGQSGFGDATPAVAAPVRPKQENAASKTVSAEIISKPTPAYTDEARKLKIEGEVLLEVVFESGGNVRVLRVVRGLGHGLDDSAVRAAEQIRFKPAQRDGQPVDFTAVLHITFQLA